VSPDFQILDFNGENIQFSFPGFNARVKIINDGETTAKKVQARIEKIELFHKEINLTETLFYHPTALKWSGEPDFDPVDIMPDSFFFLDLFYSINETSNEIMSYNKKLCEGIDQEIIDIFIKNINPSNEIYWNVWVNNPHNRGIHHKYYFEGEIVLFIIINAENCDPIKFKAKILWNQLQWNCPEIEIIFIKPNIKDSR
jgi:hypothetical protein